jgi:DNA-binding response OmpR family regulator
MGISDEMSKKIIILCEDDNDLRTVYNVMISKTGHQIELAPDGEVALELIRNKEWDLLLLDIMLPKKDGLAIIKTIFEEKLKKGKILMLTNLNTESIIAEAFKYGADGYLIKSEITPGSLLQEIKPFI